MATVKLLNPGYKGCLSGEDLRRYEELIALCKVDPYELPCSAVSNDSSLIPDINFVHITQYLVHSTRKYSMKQMCAYKSTEAHMFLTSGFVENITFYKVPSSDMIVVIGKVKHSQTLGVRVKSLLPWLLVKKNGDVLGAWCTCIAGCGEVCSHVGAALFALEVLASKNASLACTSKANSWLPPAMREVPSSEVRKIDFTASHQKRKELLENDDDCDDVPPVNIIQRTPANKERIDKLVKDLHDKGLSVAICRILPEYLEEFARKEYDLPRVLTDLFDLSLTNLSREDLTREVQCFFSACKITLKQRTEIEKLTRDQSKSHAWKTMKAGRIGGSTIYDALHTNLENPSITVVMKICYPFMNSGKTYWMDRGLKLEPIIRRLYLEKLAEEGHEEVQWRTSGLWVPLEAPYLGSSPDGFTRCKCCGVGLHEFKALKFPHPNDDHVPEKHMYQMQSQLFCVGSSAKYVDYVVYIGDDIGNGYVTIKRIQPDAALQDNLVSESEKFFKNVILLELSARFFSSRKNSTPSLPRRQPLGNSQKDNVASDLICHCNKPRQDPMIRCVGKNCHFEWYHLRCVQLKQSRKQWLCPLCKPQ